MNYPSLMDSLEMDATVLATQSGSDTSNSLPLKVEM